MIISVRKRNSPNGGFPKSVNSSASLADDASKKLTVESSGTQGTLQIG